MLCCHGVSSSSFPNSKNGSGFRLTLLTQMISMEWDRTEYNLSGGHWHENFSNTHVSTYCRQYWGHRWYCSESSMEMPGNSRFQTIGNIFENFIRINVQAKFSMRTVLYQFEGNIALWKRPKFPQYMQRIWWKTVTTQHAGLRVLRSDVWEADIKGMDIKLHPTVSRM